MRFTLNSLIANGRRVVFAACVLFTALPAAADYASIAWSADGNHWGWSRKSTQKLADEAARRGCNESAPLKDCKVSTIKALVSAGGGARASYGTSKVSLKEARSEALRQCAVKECKVIDEITDPGFIAVARTQNDDSPGYFVIVYAQTNSDLADKDAVASCEKRAKEPCRVAFSGAIPGKIAGTSPAPPPAPAPGVTANAPSCRPTTATVRCTSQCTNGDCRITYENGCQIRVQMQPEYDPFSNQWKYPPPSC